MMRFLEPCILVSGVLLLALVNILPNTAYKGLRHPVEAEAIRIYAATPKLPDPETPVRRFDDAILPEDTGERVVVYLNSDYRGRELWNKPRSTLWILGFTALLYGVASVVTRRATSRRRPQA